MGILEFGEICRPWKADAQAAESDFGKSTCRKVSEGCHTKGASDLDLSALWTFTREDHLLQGALNMPLQELVVGRTIRAGLSRNEACTHEMMLPVASQTTRPLCSTPCKADC